MSKLSKQEGPSYQRKLLASIFHVQLGSSQNQNQSQSQSQSQSQGLSDCETSPIKDGEKAHVVDHAIEQATETALNVYSNNFNENGIRALSISFPTVVGFIGEDSFRILAKKFLYHVPKESFDWAEYGSELPDYIEQQEALNDYPFLSEVATLDWAIHQAQRAEDKSFLGASFALLETGDTATLNFVGAPGLQLLPVLFPVVELYQLIHDPYLQSEEGIGARKNLLSEIKDNISQVLSGDTENEIDSETNSSKNNAINKETSRSIVLWRPEYKAQFEYVSSAEADVIHAINAKSSVNTVIETIDKHQLDLVTWLTKAISYKLIFAVA